MLPASWSYGLDSCFCKPVGHKRHRCLCSPECPVTVEVLCQLHRSSTSRHLLCDAIRHAIPDGVKARRAVSTMQLAKATHAVAGQIPAEWFGEEGLQALQELWLSENSLAGSLPR